MKFAKTTLSFLGVAIAVLIVTQMGFRNAVRAKAPALNSPTNAGDTMQAKIARAMSAGPDDIARTARIVDIDAEGNSIVLRQASNGFTCMPGNPKVIGDPPMCEDAASMQ